MTAIPLGAIPTGRIAGCLIASLTNDTCKGCARVRASVRKSGNAAALCAAYLTSNPNKGNVTMSKSNSNLFADMLRIANNKTDYDSGPVYLVHAHYSELAELVALLAKRGEQSVRACVLEYWSERTPDGKAFEADRSKLAATEKRTPEQEAQFQRMGKQNNAINMSLERAVKVYRGIAFLRSIGINVDIDKVKNTDTYETYAKRPKVERNDVFFNASQLQKIEDHIPHIKPDATAVDIRAMLKTAKKGAANITKAKGNGEAIAPSKLAEPVANLDSTLAGLAKDDGGFAVGTEASKALMLMYARMHFSYNETQRQHAYDMFAAEGANGKQAAKPINVVTAVKKAASK